MKKFFILIAMVSALAVALVPAQRQVQAGDIIDLDLTGVAPNLRGVFRRAEAFWESRINGLSNNLPVEFLAQHNGRVSITATTAAIDGPGGILGAAGPDSIAQFQQFAGTRARPNLVRQWALPQTASIFLDIADVAGPGVFDVIRHEMAHAIGFGTVWQQSGLVDLADPTFRQGLLQTRQGNLQYIGQHALTGFRRQSGHHRANFVPTENDFGPGTALGHWEIDNWFFNPANGTRTELLTGFQTGRPTFVSEATWGSLADIGWSVDGFNANDGTFRLPGVPSRPQFPKSGAGRTGFFNIVAVPEPTSASILCLGLLGMVAQRRRK